MNFDDNFHDDEFLDDNNMINNFGAPQPPRFSGPRRGGYGPPNAFGRNWGGPPPGFGPPSRFGGPPNRFGGPPPFYPSPPGLDFRWSRGFGGPPTRGPPVRKMPIEEKAIKYLQKCGVTKENLKNLPKDLLALYEPEHCGLCAHSFDTYAVSRMHYMSKNHTKNQKKWLLQQIDEAYRKNKEVPFRARDLYCELCDVHITSKVHSESHYSGKAHKSIVEGRKNPRNPFLLQEGMEKRVEQLIRREKKFMKVEPEAEAAAKAKPRPAAFTELYCEVCKTSVTCSEQMTMHLNGRRHLSKEKQHILRMMKGEQNEVSTSEEPAPAANEEQQTEIMDVEAAGNNDADHINDDWTNGSGAWDEADKSDQ